MFIDQGRVVDHVDRRSRAGTRERATQDRGVFLVGRDHAIRRPENRIDCRPVDHDTGGFSGMVRGRDGGQRDCRQSIVTSKVISSPTPKANGQLDMKVTAEGIDRLCFQHCSYSSSRWNEGKAKATNRAEITGIGLKQPSTRTVDERHLRQIDIHRLDCNAP